MAGQSDLPRECTVREAADILGCDPATIREHLRRGSIAYRDNAPPGRIRRSLRLALDDVLELRSDYKRTSPRARSNKPRNVARTYKPQHLKG